MAFLVIAHDGSDPESRARRQAVRQAHLTAIAPAVEAGTLELGGAILDDDGNMIGSALILNVETRADAEAFLQNDIYSTAGVWQHFSIYPFRRAV